MATLYNTKISATYVGLIKTIDNAVISASLKELTDGSGNQTGLYLNNAGDFKVTNVLEWGSLKDTGENITITKLVDQADGIANNNNDTSLPTSKAVKDYVDTKFSQTDTLQEVLTFGNTTGGTDIAVSANDDITFTDSSKILMGAGSDLQIYHDGSNSYIKDAGSGGLRIASDLFRVYKADLSGLMINAVPDDRVELYFNDNKKLATTSTGVDVTGNLVVSGTITGSGGSFLPLAGGTMTGNINFNDNVKSIYGNSADGLWIYHDGSNSYINDQGTGSLKILATDFDLGNSGNTASMLRAIDGGQVELYYGGSKKIETTSAGATVSGDLTVTGSITGSGGSFLPLAGGTMTGNTIHNDNIKSIYGTASDGLEIYHNGSNSFVSDTGTGLLVLSTNHLQVYNSSITEIMMSAVENGAVNLYYDNSKKFETTTSGVRVTGSLELSGTNTFTIESNSTAGTFNLGSGTRGFNFINNNHTLLSIANTGTLTANAGTENLVASFVSTDAISEIRIQDDSKYTRLLSVGQSFKIMPNDGVDLIEFNGGTSTVSVTGSLSTTGNVSIADSSQLILGGGNDVLLYHNGTDSIFRNYTGDYYIDQAAVTKSIFFRVSDANSLDTTALTISRNADASFGRDVTIAGNLTVNGTTTTINTQTLAVEDPLIELAKDNAANSVDIGFYGKYNDGTARYLGLFSDASDSNNFKLFKGTTVQPTTTIDTGGTGYEYANLILNQLYIKDFVIHHGDDNTKIGFNTNDNFEVVVGGNVNISADTNRAYLRYQGTSMAYTDSTGVLFQKNISLLDGKVLNLGSGGNDLTLYHTGGNSYIRNNTGNLEIRNQTSGASDLILMGQSANGLQTYITLDGSIESIMVNKDILMFNDGNNGKLKFGASQDLQIYHDGSNTYFDNDAGDIYFRQNKDDGDIYFQCDNGSGGLANYFYLDGGRSDTSNLATRFPDGSIILLGSGTGWNDGSQIYHSGSNFHLNEYVGNIQISCHTTDGDIEFKSDDGSGGLTEYFSLDGGNVRLNAKVDLRIYDAKKLELGNSGDLQIYHNNSNDRGYIYNATGDLYIENDATDGDIKFYSDDGSGGTALYFRIDGGSIENQFIKSTRHYDNVKAYFGDSGDLEIYHDGSNSHIDDTGTGNLLIRGSANVEIEDTDGVNMARFKKDNSVDLYYDGTKKFETTTNGIQITNTEGTQIRFQETDSTYTESMRIIRYQDSLGFHYGDNANEEAFLIDNTGNATAYKNLTVVQDVTINGAEYVNQIQARTSAGLKLGNDNNSGYVFVKDSGEVCVGTSSPSSNTNYGTGDLNVENDVFASAQIMSHNSTAGNYSFLGLGKSSGTGASPTIVQANETVGVIGFYGYDGGAYKRIADIRSAIDGTPGSGDMPGRLEFHTASDGTAVPSERMRITDDGLLFVGDTTTNYGYSSHHIARDYSQGYALIIRNSNTSTQNNSVLQLNQAETTSTTQGYLLIGRQGDANTGTNRIFIYSNGNVQNVNNSYGAISDERLKENIVDATPKLDDLMKVKIRNYNFIGQEDKQIGVIAQEIENVFPSLVEDTKEPESEETTKSVKYSVLVPIMLKAIQELKAEVDLLKQECKCKN